MMRSMARVAPFLAALCCLGADARAGPLINVDFNAGLSPTYSGAAVLGTAGDAWNGIVVNSAGGASNLALVDSSGMGSGVTLSYNTPSMSVGGFSIFGSPLSPFQGTAYASLMQDYLYVIPSMGPATTTFSGLTAGGTYRLILYSSADSIAPGQARGRDTGFTVHGVTEHVVQGSDSAFVEGSNYADFTAAADPLGNLSFTTQGFPYVPSPAFPDFTRSEGNLNGMQLSAVPEPSTLAMFGFASLWIAIGALCRRFRERP